DAVLTTHLIANQIHEIVLIISHCRLNLRLINQKEEIDLPEGIILNQTPTAGTGIKPNQPIFIVTTKKPKALPVPACIGMKVDQITLQLEKIGICPRIYNITHHFPAQVCFAQLPEHNEPIEKNKFILYISA